MSRAEHGPSLSKPVDYIVVVINRSCQLSVGLRAKAAATMETKLSAGSSSYAGSMLQAQRGLRPGCSGRIAMQVGSSGGDALLHRPFRMTSGLFRPAASA